MFEARTLEVRTLGPGTIDEVDMDGETEKEGQKAEAACGTELG